MPVIATAGHVDHGKSSLIQTLTGINPDRLEEEKRKGMTIDLGFAHVTTQGTTLSFVDVPGHADFIRTMISGVTGVDIALLVIDAGEGWKPQTEEHLGILEVLGVRHGVVALTKCDKWDADHLNRRRQEIHDRLSSSSVVWHDIVPTSVVTQEGLDDLVDILASLTVQTSRATRPGSARLFIDRVFSMKGSGTVVTGTLDTAPLHTGDALVIARTQQPVRIREIQVHGKSVENCEPGSRCAINVTGVDSDALTRGDALITPGGWITTSVFDAQIALLPGLNKPLTHRGSFTIHIGSDYQSASIRILENSEILPNTTGKVRVRFSRPLPLVPSDKFLLRDTSTNTTLGGGTILDVDPITRVSLARPEGTVESIMHNRGFIDINRARLLTGVDLTPVVGDWFARADDIDTTKTSLRERLKATNEMRLAELLPFERELLSHIDGVVIENGIARLGDTTSIDEHPVAQLIRQWGLTGSSSSDLDRNVVRRLVQRGVVFEHDSIAFHRDTLESLRPQLTYLWEQSPDGFTVAELRTALSITRKHAVPLAECLDKYGLTKRSGDTRLRGHRW